MKDSKTFEYELPAGYKQICHLNALDKKIGIILNVVALIVMIVVFLIAFIPIVINKSLVIEIGHTFSLLMIITMFLYIVLHELVHGIVYKLKTKEKLTFGYSWSCAFCGVPNIYVYRKTAIAAVAAPLIVFSAIYIPLMIFLYFVSPTYYILVAFLLAFHLGGCVGDAYVLYLLMKNKNDMLLVKDTGPEQLIYVPADAENMNTQEE